MGYTAMLTGGVMLAYGFYLAADRKWMDGWGGFLMMGAGLVLAFLGVIFTYVPDFFAR